MTSLKRLKELRAEKESGELAKKAISFSCGCLSCRGGKYKSAHWDGKSIKKSCLSCQYLSEKQGAIKPLRSGEGQKGGVS
jgi:hypothetical protein